MNQELFYKLAQPNGFDFYTGKTINYRNAIGQTVQCPNYNPRGKLCSSAFIHASKEANQCFIGAKIPCSIYRVSGIPILKDTDKCGFKELFILKELQPEKVFKWNYKEACNPINPFKIKPPIITQEHIILIKEWASVLDSVGVSVGVSVLDSVLDSVGVSVGASVGDSVWAYIGSLFIPEITDWKYIKYKKGKYPFQSCVNLWQKGLVPSYDGQIWRLHGGKKGKILWEGTKKEI